MPDFQFESIDISNGQCIFKPWVKMGLRNHAELHNLADNARIRAENAIELFCGILYAETPYFACSGIEFLPWAHKYWTGQNRSGVRVSEEEFRYFAKVMELPRCFGAEIPEPACTYLEAALCESPRFMTQGLAFEALYCFDRHLGCLLRYQHIAAMGWLETANANHIEAMSQARSIPAVLEPVTTEDISTNREHAGIGGAARCGIS